MIGTIARKELTELLRDGRFRLAGMLVVALLLVTIAAGWRQQAATRAEREAASVVARAQWAAQDDKNPHMAAHYGTWVFKPAGALSFVDPGVEPVLGVAVKLEAHRQNLMQDAAARDGTALQRLGRLTPATVLQLLVPLLVIALAFAAFTGERERGTLRQLASLGVPAKTLLAGKALGISGALLLLLVPALLLGALAVALLGGAGDGGAGSTGRLALLVASYLAYLGVLVALSLLVSAVAPSSRVALVALLGFWVLTSLVLPRAVGNLAETVIPPQTAAQLARAVDQSLAQGLPGGPEREARIEELSRQLLEKHGFAGIEAMMDESLLQGLELQAEAAFENEVFDHHFGKVFQRVEQQERLVRYAGFLSPFVAIRSLSMGFAGTDFAHHRAFTAAAERYRRSLVALLNEDFAKNAGRAGWDYKAGRALWDRAPAFVHEAPGAWHAVSGQVASILALLLWLAVTSAGALVAVRRMRVF